MSQLEALTDIQAVTVTADQRAAMSADQSAILGEVTTDGEEEVPEVTAAPPSTGKCSGCDNYSRPEGFMSADQIAILGEVTTGGEEEEPEVTAAPPSTGKCSDSDNYS